MDELSARFPDDLAYDITYDTTLYVETSIQEVIITLFQALALVILVVFVFLQDWRSTLIPAIAIPVSLITTFAASAVLGFTINTVSLFGLILAIGIVVDDAIIVVENVQRHMSDGLDPREATRKAMEEVTGPVVATTLVLLAVFVPIAFTPGLTGRLFIQFVATIAFAVSFSSINALTLSPALCASFLRPSTGARRGPLAWFERGLTSTRNGISEHCPPSHSADRHHRDRVRWLRRRDRVDGRYSPDRFSATRGPRRVLRRYQAAGRRRPAANISRSRPG